MERQCERVLVGVLGAGEEALVGVGLQERQREGADLRLDPLRPQPRQDIVATLDLDHVGLPAVDVARIGVGQRHGQAGEPLGVAGREALPGREQRRQPAELRQPDGGEDVGEAVVEPGAGRSPSASERQPWLRNRATAAAIRSSSVVTAPPSPVVTIFRGWKLRQAARPSEPHGRP